MAKKRASRSSYKIGFWIAVLVIAVLAAYIGNKYASSSDENDVPSEDALDVPDDLQDVSPYEDAVKDTEKDAVAPASDAIVISITEGETLSFPNLEVEDPDGDEVVITFSEPLDERGEWRTQRGDAGIYDITITASDGIDETVQQVTVMVKPLNLPPVIDIEEVIMVRENETVTLQPTVYDPEGEAVEVAYSGWMDSATRFVEFGEAGEYTVTITATDGEHVVEKNVTIIVEAVNRPPVFRRVI